MNWEPTKEQPGRYSDILKEIAKIEDTATTKRITYNSIDAARSGVKSRWVKFTDMLFCIKHQEIMCIGVEIKGGVKVLKFNGFEMPVLDYTKAVSTIVNKSIKDYKTQPDKVGSYKNCEGGGWHSMANPYKLNGKYYTDAY